MSQSWKEDFFGKLVEASHAACDARLATGTLHRCMKTASYEHPQLRRLECVFDGNRSSGNQDSHVLVVECNVRKGTEADGPVLKREFTAAGISGDLRLDSDVAKKVETDHGEVKTETDLEPVLPKAYNVIAAECSTLLHVVVGRTDHRDS